MAAEGWAVAGTGKTALVVDDERLVRMLMVDALEVCGYAVLEAADGPSGLRVLQSATQIDLLVVDHHLPNGVTGREVAETARRTRPFLKVLLVSGLPTAVVTQNRPLPERVRLLSKPFSMVSLVTTVAELMRPPPVQVRPSGEKQSELE